ncbi:MAG: acyl-CoA dehydrogenase family protein [Sporomusaceae bacterium]|nr:acyl-CoA dehydrogenase family protein [Sporomusaceae bacterium]
MEEWLEKVRAFCDKKLSPLAYTLDKENRFPRELLGDLQELGLWGSQYPQEYGGAGRDVETVYQAVTEIAKASAGVSLTLIVHWMACDTLLKFGTKEQQATYLRPMLQGDKIAAFTISEPQAGSDAAAIEALAVKTEQGWSLSGTKYFCTNGALADLYFIAVKTAPDLGAKGISLVILEKGATGFTIGEPLEKLGCRSSQTTSLLLNQVEIQEEQIVGNVNSGFKAALYGLVGGRLGMAVMGLGIAEAAFAAATAYAKKRQAFGKPISKLYAMQEKTANMVISLQAYRLLTADAVKGRAAGSDYSEKASIAKLYGARAAQEITYEALQVLGGHGYMKHHPLERYARDARLMDIGVGSSEVLKMVLGSTYLA